MTEADEQIIASEQQQVLRGDSARRLLEDPIFVEAFAAVRADLQAKMFATKPSQSAEREKIYLSALMLTNVETEIEAHIQRGQMAKASLIQRARGVLHRAAEPLRTRFAK